MIPFASGFAPRATTNTLGASSNAIPIGFGLGTYDLDLPILSDLSINLAQNINRQQAFSIPANCNIKSLYISCVNYEAITVPANVTAFPVVQLYKATRDSNTFVPIAETAVTTVNGFSGIVPVGAIDYGSIDNITVPVNAGDRLVVIGKMITTGTGILSQGYRIYYTGGILLK